MGEEVEREVRPTPALPVREGGKRKREEGRGCERKTHPGPPCREGERIRSDRSRKEWKER